MWQDEKTFLFTSSTIPDPVFSFIKYAKTRRINISWKGAETDRRHENQRPEIVLGRTNHSLEIYGDCPVPHEGLTDERHLKFQHPGEPGIFRTYKIKHATASIYIYIALDHNLALACIIADDTEVDEIPGFERVSSEVLEACLYQTRAPSLVSHSLSAIKILAQTDGSFSYFTNAVMSFRQTFRKHLGRNKNDCKVLVQLTRDQDIILLVSIRYLKGPSPFESLWLEIVEFESIEDYKSFVRGNEILRGKEMKRREEHVWAELAIFRKYGS